MENDKAAHISRVTMMSNAYKRSVGKPEAKGLLENV
jgi:hypothetical protein